jgi:hypothetical protein
MIRGPCLVSLLRCKAWGDGADTRVDVISRPDSKDATCASASTRARAREMEDEVRRRVTGLAEGRLDGLRIGIPVVRPLLSSIKPT